MHASYLCIFTYIYSYVYIYIYTCVYKYVFCPTSHAPCVCKMRCNGRLSKSHGVATVSRIDNMIGLFCRI